MADFAYKVKSRRFNCERIRFQYHPLPREDELLSSWLTRTALSHLTDPATFVNLYLPEWKNILWTRDIDVSADRRLLEALSLKSGLSYEVLYGLTLKSYESFLAEKISPKTINPFIKSLKNHGRVKVGYGLRFCPECLKSGETPYFRKKWRLSFSTACIVHNCFLLDRCQKCRAPLTLYRNYYEYGFPICHKCGFDLRRAQTEPIDPGSYGLTAIRRLYEILDTGIFRYKDKYVYSFLFFRVLRHFVKLTKFWGRTAGLLEHEVMKKNIVITDEERNHNSIDDIPLKEQYLLFSGVVKMFEDYPESFLSFCNLNRLRFTDLTRDVGRLPYWYEEVVRDFDKGWEKISIEEVKNVIRYIEKKGIIANKWKVAKLMGVCPDFRKRGDIRGLFLNA